MGLGWLRGSIRGSTCSVFREQIYLDGIHAFTAPGVLITASADSQKPIQVILLPSFSSMNKLQLAMVNILLLASAASAMERQFRLQAR